MNKTTRWIVILALAAAVILFFLPKKQPPEQQVVIPRQESTQDKTEPLTRFPVPEAGAPAPTEPAKPLPSLKESDAAIQESLGQLADPNQLGQLLILKNIINRFVVTIDNLPRAKLPLRNLPDVPPPGKFLVKKTEQGVIIDPENYKRYTGYVQFFTSMDSQKIVSVYSRFYPLFQEAYSDLGYKSAYFNDRLIAAIDDLLAAPEVKGPVQLVQPSVFYKYADPRLESLSAGQKIMVRIGNDNAAKVKAKLQELRQALTQRKTGK